MTHREIELCAAEVWSHCGGRPALPRDLEPYLALLAPLIVVSLPDLSPQSVCTWLDERDYPIPHGPMPNCRLLGSLLAYRGRGVIFLETALQADERRVIVAHEFSHFLLHYQRPRQRAIRTLGETIVPVLDGDSRAELPRELAAALAGVPIAGLTHVFDFDQEQELTASRLALELLAPWADVSTATVRELVETWGLPERWARSYRARLDQNPSFASQFGL